ncbi:unnamed protein product, partial [marine sediment metagenome]
YQNRKAWLPAVMQIKDANIVYWDLVSYHNELRRMVVREYMKADNSNAAIGALRLLRDLNLDFSELIVTRDALERIERLEQKGVN